MFQLLKLKFIQFLEVKGGKVQLSMYKVPYNVCGIFVTVITQDVIENRAAYRALCFSTPGLSEHISGVILHWETLFQDDAEGKAMVDIIKGNGIIPGIKVDKGYNKKGMWGTQTGPLGHPEVATVGLDDLQQKCQQAYAKGARFAKWRNVLQLDPAKGLPSELAIADTVHTLARYASICQSERLVPIVEPEIVPNGNWNFTSLSMFDPCK